MHRLLPDIVFTTSLRVVSLGDSCMCFSWIDSCDMLNSWFACILLSWCSILQKFHADILLSYILVRNLFKFAKI